VHSCAFSRRLCILPDVPVDRAISAASLLDADPDLGRSVQAHEWAAARRALACTPVELPAGKWNALDAGPVGEHVIGVLAVEGVLVRQTTLRDKHLLELLGPGDIFQPPHAPHGALAPAETTIAALGRSVVIPLGAWFARAAGRWPGLLEEVQRREEAQRERLAIRALIAHLPRADERLLLVLTQLAEQWGCRTPAGITVPFTLTHELLGHLAAARRPTVTLALKELESAGCVQRNPDGTWLVTPPGERRVTRYLNDGHTVDGMPTSLLKLQYTAAQTLETSRALRAESKQLRAMPPPAAVGALSSSRRARDVRDSRRGRVPR
jgi:CRP-like cAMP-binding protein